MIINFNIHNFGSIRNKQTLSFEATNSTDLEEFYIIHAANGLRILKLGLIYGANASGKTTVLKALDFLRKLILYPAEKKTEALDFNPFLFDPKTPNQNSILAIEFIQSDVKYSYEVEFNKKAIVREELNYYKPNKANVFKRTTDLEKQFTEITFGSKIKQDKTFEKTLEANTLWNNTVLGGFLKTNIEIQELNEVIDWFSSYLEPMINSKTELDSLVTKKIVRSLNYKNTLVHILKKADLNISDVLLEKSEHEEEYGLRTKWVNQILNEPEPEYHSLSNPFMKIEFEHSINGSKYKLPFKLESQGTQRFFGFAGLLSLLISNPFVFLVDELESSLHPDLYIHLLLSFLANSKNSQLLATSHNRELLNNRDLFRNDAIWFTDKDESGATELYSLADFDSKVIRDSSNILNAYKAGKLGGVPNLGDYFINTANEE